MSYISEMGTVDIPDDLSKATITAYVPGSGGYTVISVKPVPVPGRMLRPHGHPVILFDEFAR